VLGGASREKKEEEENIERDRKTGSPAERKKRRELVKGK